jgi:hypothetical protein
MLDLGVPISALRLPDEVRASPWFELLTPRQKENLAYKWHKTPDRSTYEVSQSMGRSSSSATTCAASPDDDIEVSCAIIPRSLIWLPSGNRLLTGYEHCMLQCLPTTAIPGLEDESRALLIDLAGNMFNGANYMAALVSLFAALPETFALRPRSDHAESDNEVTTMITDRLSGVFDEVPADELSE